MKQKLKLLGITLGILVSLFALQMLVGQNKVEAASYETKMNLEEPVSGKRSAKQLHIKGWVMTNAPQYAIKVYLNDKEVATITKRVTRTDVLAGVSGCGGSKSNPKPGYGQTIDLSSYASGRYSLKLQIINTQNNQILEQTQRNIMLQNYPTTMNLEEPANGKQVTASMTVKGWVMSELSNAQIDIAVDGTVVKTVQNRVMRTDVLKAIEGYGGSKKNPKPGYQETINLSGYKDGTHSITVTVKHPTTNEVLETTTRSITLKKYPTTMNLESPSPNSTVTTPNLTVKGWVMSQNANAKIQIKIDGKEVKVASNRVARTDVLNAISGYGGKTSNPKPGYQETINLDGYQDGKHSIQLNVLNPTTNEVLETTTRNFTLRKYDTTMNLETPTASQTVKDSMTVKGWVMSENRNAQIQITIDNTVVKTVQNRVARGDVISGVKGYGGQSTNPKPGYQETIDLSSYKDGTHTIGIKVVNPTTNETLISTSRKFNIKKYSALFNIEEPTSAPIYSKTIRIKGWAMANTKNTSLKVYIDNKEVSQKVQRVARPDVIKAHGNTYGKENVNPTPGFLVEDINIENYAAGYHTVTVKLWNTKTNEEIGSMNKKVLFRTDVKTGIDVSSYQGTIDWAKVKKDGIEFAMLRAGFRGWGTSDDGVNGKLVQDTKFDENAKNAIKNGIPIGAYFFSQAINEEEAIEEAKFVVSIIKDYKITYPVVIDVEYSGAPNNTGRADKVSKEMRTKICKAFADYIKKAGYTPMIYADKNFATNNLDMSKLSGYSFWLAHYTGATQDNPLDKPSNYSGKFKMWQYTSSGKVNGVNGNTDMNIWYD